MHPRQSPTTHTEQLGDEVAVYDQERAQLHALNPTAACVWRQCDGATSPDAMAAALARDRVPEAEAVVDLTLRELMRLHLLESPVDSRAERPARTRRWLLGRGVAAAMLPTIYSIVAPSPADAQSLPPPEAPTLTRVSPNEGIRGETILVTLTGTNFVVGATTVNVSADVTVANVAVTSSTSLTASFVLDLVPAAGARTVTVETAGGTSGGQPFTITLPLPGSMTFTPTGEEQTFLVPAGVVSIRIQAEGGPGGNSVLAANGGDGGRTVARVSVAPGTQLTVRVGGGGQFGTPSGLAAGGFNGGGGSTGAGGAGGGGASSVHDDGDNPLVIAGGGGGGGGASGNALGGDGGGLIAEPGFPTPLAPEGGDPGGGGTQSAGGAGGTGKGSVTAQSGTAGMAGSGGIGGNDGSGGGGGGGGGGGYFGGGGGGGGTPGGGGGGAGSSFTADGATDVLHMQGCCLTGRVIISW